MGRGQERSKPHFNMRFALRCLPRPRRIRYISHLSKSLSCASVLLGSPGYGLPGRRCSAAVPLVFSGHQQAFHYRDAAGTRLRRRGPSLAAVRPGALDGGLWLSKTAQMLQVQLII